MAGSDESGDEASRHRSVLLSTFVRRIKLPSFRDETNKSQYQSSVHCSPHFMDQLLGSKRSTFHSLDYACLNRDINYSNGQPSPIAVVPTFILQQKLLAVSLISVIIPDLKAFLQSLSASWGEAGFGSGYTTKAYGNITLDTNDMTSNTLPVSRRSMGGLY